MPELLSHEHDGLSQIWSRLVIKGIVGEFEGLFRSVRNFRRVFKGFWLLRLFTTSGGSGTSSGGGEQLRDLAEWGGMKGGYGSDTSVSL